MTALTENHLTIENVNIADCDIVFAQDLVGDVLDDTERLENVSNDIIKTPVIIAASAEAICAQENSIIYQGLSKLLILTIFYIFGMIIYSCIFLDVNICVEESTTQANQSLRLDNDASDDSGILTAEDSLTSTSQQTATSDEPFASEHSSSQGLIDSEILDSQNSVSTTDLRAS